MHLIDECLRSFRIIERECQLQERLDSDRLVDLLNKKSIFITDSFLFSEVIFPDISVVDLFRFTLFFLENETGCIWLILDSSKDTKNGCGMVCIFIVVPNCSVKIQIHSRIFRWFRVTLLLSPLLHVLSLKLNEETKLRMEWK